MTYYSGHYDDEPVTRANETWRNDPARKEAWRSRIEEVQGAYAEAHEHLRRAVEALRSVGPLSTEDEVLESRGRDAVERALVTFDRDSRQVMAEPNDCYLGNRAAFRLPPGWDRRQPLTERRHG